MKFLFTFTAMIFSLWTIQAQVAEVQESMSQGAKNGLSINLTGTTPQIVEAAWQKFVKEYKGKTKKDKKASEVFTDNAMIKNMSGNTVDIYASAKPEGDDVKFTTWFDLGGAYLSAATHPDAYSIAEGMLNDFSTSVSVSAVEEMLKEEENVLGKMEGEMKSLVKENTNLEDEIAKCEKKIEEAKLKIEENKTAQGMKQKEIDGQMEKVKMTKEKLSKF